jgi:hypothetical protein
MSSPQDDQDRYVFNGIDGLTGRYLTAPLDDAQLLRLAVGDYTDPKKPDSQDVLARSITAGAGDARHLQELILRNEADVPHYGLRPGNDPTNLAQAGWGVIFAPDADPAVKDALKELLDWRTAQAGDRFVVFDSYKGYRPGEGYLEFLARQRMGPGPADPRKVPYYLLIVGDPETIPFEFQYQLDVQYAVGRLWFETAEEYANYARSVVAAEKGHVALARRAVLFGVKNPDDPATKLSATMLVEPLAALLPSALGDSEPPWEVEKVVADEAKKSRLAALLGGDRTPALLFTASHGMAFPKGNPRQMPHQGAFLCQDWPGPYSWPGNAIPPDFYFSADDVADDASFHGRITFHFACYGGGTPMGDYFDHIPGQVSYAAPKPLVARLPRRLLGHPKGGVLAVIGHVDRAFGYSFSWKEAGVQTQSFEDALAELMRGRPVGLALESLNQRYADLSSNLSHELRDVRYGKVPNAPGLAGLWTANNDARSYIILGDPAARLPLVKANS